MSRRLFSVCLILALSGCGAATTKTTPDAGSTAADAPTFAPSESAIAGNSTAAADDEQRPPADAPDKVASSPPTSAEDPPAAKAEELQELTPDAALAAAQKLLRKRDMAGAAELLEHALAGHPENIQLLLNLARMNAQLAVSDRETPDYSRQLASAEYLRRAFKLDSKLRQVPGWRGMAALIYYNEACALAIDKKPEEALKSLNEAVDFGIRDFASLETNPDLESVRALSEFPEFLAKAREIHRELLKTEVEELFASTKPFEFDFELTDIEGNPIAKANFVGKVLIVDVWGTWCPPCRMEIPHFVALQEKFKEAEFAIVGLNSERGDDEEALKLVQKFHQENGMNYRCALVQRDLIKQIPDFQGFPTTLFLDRKGNVRARAVGYHEYDLLEMLVQRLLDEKTAPSAE